jgi:lipoprotein-releasing system permease protein
MKASFFVASRVATRSGGTSFARTIIRIAIAATALSMAVMIVANALENGFRKTISEKVFGFWGHVQLTHLNTDESYLVRPLDLHQVYYPSLDTLRHVEYPDEDDPTTMLRTRGGIRHIQAFVNKEGVIRTKDQIEGIVLRGVGADFDWTFFDRYLEEGSPPAFGADSLGNGIVVSHTTAQRLQLGIGDKLQVYFVQNEKQMLRQFVVRAIYKTGLGEFDRMFALVDRRHLQKLNGWRPFAQWTQIAVPQDSLYRPGRPRGTDQPFMHLPDVGSVIRLRAVSPLDSQQVRPRLVAGSFLDPQAPDFQGVVLSEVQARRLGAAIGDTLEMIYHDAPGEAQNTQGSRWNTRLVLQGTMPAIGLSEADNLGFVDARKLQEMNEALDEQVGGFEIFTDDIRDLDLLGRYIDYEITTAFQRAMTIRETQSGIFDWLGLLETNETIIRTLMIIIAVLNLTTALLILILERTHMIGTLQALGMANGAIRQIFLYHAAAIAGAGMLIGNLVGLALCFAQQQWGLVRLPEDAYYVSTAPVSIDWGALLWLNVLTLAITFLALLLPTLLVSGITPVKALRFR